MKKKRISFLALLLTALFGYAPEIYWHYVTLESPGYYISYAMSAVPSLELYAMATESGLDNALDAYMSLIEYDLEEGVFLDVLADAGIALPTEKRAFESLFEVFREVFVLNLTVSPS